MKLYHSPRSRSVRIYWLLEELGVPYELETIKFTPPPRPFAQTTPSGKVPTLEDGEVTMFESGAIVEWVLDCHGKGRMAPPPGSPQRAAYLQWIHFAESTAFMPLGNIAFHTIFKRDAERIPDTMADYRGWATAAFDVLERALAGREYLLGAEFSGADVMMGYTLLCAKWFNLLGDAYPNLTAYLQRLEARPALQKALA